MKWYAFLQDCYQDFLHCISFSSPDINQSTACMTLNIWLCWIDYFRINVLYIFYEIRIANNRTWVPDTSFVSHVLLAWPEMLAKSDYGFAFECLVTWLLISLIHWCHFLSVWARVKHPACTSTFPQEEYCTFII